MTTLIGTNPDQIPVNSMLGGMAYQDPDNVSVGKITYSGTLLGNGDVVFGGSSTIWTSTGRTSLNVNGTSSSIISLSTGGSVDTSGYLYWDNLNFDIQNNTVGGLVRIGTKDYPNALIISSSGNLTLSGTGATKLQEGTTAQRPASPQEGMIRKNSTTGRVESYVRGSWVNLVEEPPSTRNNLLDNAGFVVENRFRETSHTGAGNITKFITDRWFFESTDPHSSTNLAFSVNSGNIASVTYAGHALTFQSNAAATLNTTTHCRFGQRIWPTNQKHSSLTLSFMVKASVTGNYSFCLISNARRYVGTFTVNVSNTFERKVVNIPALSITAGSDAQSYTLTFNLGTHSSLKVTPSGSWEFTTTPAFATGTIDLLTSNAADLAFVEMKLEYGDVATPFTLPSYAEELNNCRLHYQQSGLLDDKLLFSTTFRTSAVVTGLFTPFDTVCLSPRMRELPIVTVYNPITGSTSSARNNTAGTNVPVLVDYTSVVSFKVYVNNTSVTAGDKLHIAWEAATGS